MKFIAGLRVWVNGALGKTPQVFPRIRGSANRRVDLHVPLIASISGRRQGTWGERRVARRTLGANHASRAPKGDVGGQPRFRGARKWVAPNADRGFHRL